MTKNYSIYSFGESKTCSFTFLWVFSSVVDELLTCFNMCDCVHVCVCARYDYVWNGYKQFFIIESYLLLFSFFFFFVILHFFISLSFGFLLKAPCAAYTTLAHGHSLHSLRSTNKNQQQNVVVYIIPIIALLFTLCWVEFRLKL